MQPRQQQSSVPAWHNHSQLNSRRIDHSKLLPRQFHPVPGTKLLWTERGLLPPSWAPEIVHKHSLADCHDLSLRMAMSPQIWYCPARTYVIVQQTTSCCWHSPLYWHWLPRFSITLHLVIAGDISKSIEIETSDDNWMALELELERTHTRECWPQHCQRKSSIGPYSTAGLHLIQKQNARWTLLLYISRRSH